MFVDLFEHDFTCFVKVLLHVFQYSLHDIIDVFNFNCFKSFTSDDVFDVVETKKYTRIEVLVNIKKT